VQNCDEYYSYNALAGLVKSGDETGTKKWDPYELVTESITRMQKNGDVMRSDRLKQVMQELDPTFDEKNLGMSKFSRFCMEAANKGLLHVHKLENGQLEVGPAKGAVAPAVEARREGAESGEAREGREGGRGRRGRRGRGGRGRDREGRGPAAGDAETNGSAPQADGAPEAKPAHAARPEPRRHERGGQHAPKVDESIGVEGVRLTRDEAFKLVSQAVEAATVGDRPVPSEAVRARARLLLARDSESLSPKNFARILKDAHDAGLLDLRKRGEAFEVTAVIGAPSIADQLAVAEAKATPVAVPTAPAPRGMGIRGAPSRGGKTVTKAMPAGLLLLGMVEEPTPAPVAEPVKKGRAKKATADDGAEKKPKAKRVTKKKVAAAE